MPHRHAGLRRVRGPTASVIAGCGARGSPGRRPHSPPGDHEIGTGADVGVDGDALLLYMFVHV
ncbi:hypothetical protein Ae406Ps2_2584c [Pseudonocardia sp. Ae406_Ps2]|nr:hypothetical protein Ae406Ps2_2584c [Pseudonocardia sp. Ae406_Ps2]OLM24153.1 hypothetical protein Ae706Ps2_2586c [Pseudonocardia sp. Ae706_Ps2]